MANTFLFILVTYIKVMVSCNTPLTKLLVKAVGNFGVAFFSPLVGGNLAETMFNLNMTLDQLVYISFFSALFVTGLSVSKQAVEWSNEKKK